MPDESPATPLLELALDPGPRTVVFLRGDLDPATAPTLEAAVDELVRDPAVDQVVLDLAGLAFIDSSGLRVFVTVREALDARGATLVLRNPSSNTQRLLDITGLSEVVVVEG